MCSTLLKTSLLLFGMLVSSAYGSGNDVLREEVMSTSKALRLLCIEGDWSFTFKVLLLLLSLCSTKLNLRYRPNNATASETLTDNMTLSKESVFIRPSSDGTYYGMVMSVRPSVRVSVRPSQFSALFSYMLWDIELKFCVSLYFDARKSKFECRQFPSIFAGVMPPFNFKLSQICSFPHFFPTWFEILSWNFAYDFVIL